jgi:hypothetical protein
MMDLFKRDNAPYLFAIIIAILGWLITRSVDEITKSPLVVYDLDDSTNIDGARQLILRVRNISRTTAFRNLYVLLSDLDGNRSKFTKAAAHYEAPVHISEDRKTTAECGATWAGILIKDLQPNTAVRLVTTIAGSDTPTVRCESATDTIRLVKGGIVTWIIQNETAILLWLAVGLIALLLFYIVWLGTTRSAAAVVGSTLIIVLSHGICTAGTIRVIDDSSGKAVQCNIYLQDENALRHRAGRTDQNGLCRIDGNGKQGQKYVAVSEEYNPGFAECPITSTTITVSKTIYLADHLKKADYLTEVNAPAAAALELRKASVIAEKHHDDLFFNSLEYRVIQNAAKALGVDQPFVTTSSGVRPSDELTVTLREYQNEQDLKPTGKLNTDTIRRLANATTPATDTSARVEKIAPAMTGGAGPR